jgi:RNA polymerase primary sigma factor
MKINTDKQFIVEGVLRQYLNDIKKYKILSRKEELEIYERILNGDENARDRLIKCNLRYVVKLVRTFTTFNVSIKELISEGNAGLTVAAHRFDYVNNNNIKFISYATFWIKQYVINYLNEHSRTVRIPVNVINDIRKAKKDNNDSVYGEIEEYFGEIKTVSIDNKSDDEQSLIEILADTTFDLPDSLIEQDKKMKEIKLKNMLSVLSLQEKEIICKYFGLDGDEMTLTQIAEDIDLTKERVRQIKEKALRKLRNDSRLLMQL